MRYASFKCGPWGKPGWLGDVLKWVLPLGNPDFEGVYERVVSWWFEIDESNVVHRELAFDASGEVVAAAPLGNNEGIFTDLDSAPDGLGPEVEASSFEEKWQEARDRWFESRFTKR